MEINKIYNEDCLETLRRMPDCFIDNCVTSPPYYGLRDYGHPDQSGIEETPEQYVQKLVEVFREVRRVLRKDGTLWLNLGDSYAGGGGGNYNKSGISQAGGQHITNVRNKESWLQSVNLKPKDLIGIPWRVAFALQSDGWWLRQDIIWHKPNPMPESVTDRCTKAHEYIFLLTKSAKYWYDAKAIKVPMEAASLSRLSQNIDAQEGSDGVPGKTNGKMKAVGMYVGGKKHKNMQYDGQVPNTFHKTRNDNGYEWQSDDGKANRRSVWTVTTKPFSGAHFATFPEDLIEPCILTTKKDAIIYDPFGGSGTTGVVALRAERRFILSELNPQYVKIAEKRLSPHLHNLFTS